ncbi:MAG: MFS transporter, partial [Notoacmeibacter sp.]|nr:MFS transporter [Notoacmeibacter sp.]
MLGVGLAWPVLPKLIQQMGGGDVSGAAFTYGVLAGGFALAQFFFQPLAGALSDRFGRKPVLLAALAGSGADFAIIAFAPSLFWLAVARILGGVFAATNSTANAYMADVSAPEDRSRNFGLVGAAFGFGFIAGPLVGGMLGDIDLRLPFLFAAGLAALNLVFGLVFLPESLAPEHRKAFSLASANPFGALARMGRLPGLVPLMAAFLLAAVAQRGLEAIWVLFLDFRFGWGVREASFSL